MEQAEVEVEQASTQQIQEQVVPDQQVYVLL
jgi:hypothetical protein